MNCLLSDGASRILNGPCRCTAEPSLMLWFWRCSLGRSSWPVDLIDWWMLIDLDMCQIPTLMRLVHRWLLRTALSPNMTIARVSKLDKSMIVSLSDWLFLWLINWLIDHLMDWEDVELVNKRMMNCHLDLSTWWMDDIWIDNELYQTDAIHVQWFQTRNKDRLIEWWSDPCDWLID